jgi:Domain of unknown function (DUF4156)
VQPNEIGYKISYAMFALSISLAGCASIRSEAVQKVSVVDETAVTQCQFLGKVSGSSIFGVFVHDRSQANTLSDMQSEAAGLGATHLVIDQQRTGVLLGGMGSGKAYRCDKA